MSWIPAFEFLSAIGLGGITYYFADNYLFDSIIANMPDNTFGHAIVILWRVLPVVIVIATAFGFLMLMQKRNYMEIQ